MCVACHNPQVFAGEYVGKKKSPGLVVSCKGTKWLANARKCTNSSPGTSAKISRSGKVWAWPGDLKTENNAGWLSTFVHYHCSYATSTSACAIASLCRWHGGRLLVLFQLLLSALLRSPMNRMSTDPAWQSTNWKRPESGPESRPVVRTLSPRSFPRLDIARA